MNEIQQIYSNIGKRIRKARKSKRMTLEDLAFKINMDYSFIARIETGKAAASLETLYKISKGLEIKFYQLFNNIDPKKETFIEKEFITAIRNLSFEEKEKILAITKIVMNK